MGVALAAFDEKVSIVALGGDGDVTQGDDGLNAPSEVDTCRHKGQLEDIASVYPTV